MLRERLEEHCAERAIEGTLCCESDWWNTVQRKTVREHCAEREIGEHCSEREIAGTLCRD